MLMTTKNVFQDGQQASGHRVSISGAGWDIAAHSERALDAAASTPGVSNSSISPRTNSIWAVSIE
jgi:hypothetical protein